MLTQIISYYILTHRTSQKDQANIWKLLNSVTEHFLFGLVYFLHSKEVVMIDNHQSGSTADLLGEIG